jgi:O-antigen/teichoic acid export membrane protein
MEDIKLAEKLWDTANIVTGFAVAQILAVIFALANNQMAMLSGPQAHWAAAVGTLIFTTFYLFVISWCYTEAKRLSPKHPLIWRMVNRGRIGAVILFTFAFFVTLYGHRNEEIKAEARVVLTP